MRGPRRVGISAGLNAQYEARRAASPERAALQSTLSREREGL